MPEITIDSTQYSYVILCDAPDCEHWRAARSTRSGAWRAAADHLRHVHDDTAAATAATNAARNCEHRQRMTRPDNHRRPANRSDQRRPARSTRKQQ